MFTEMSLDSHVLGKRGENFFADFLRGNCFKIYTKLIKETLEKCKTKHLMLVYIVKTIYIGTCFYPTTDTFIP